MKVKQVQSTKRGKPRRQATERHRRGSTKATRKAKKKRKPMFVKSGAVISARIEVMRSVACEPFAQVKATGRFTLRDEGKTIAIGKVLKCE